VAAAVGEVRERHGRVDALVHAAGLEISRLLPDKEPREFDLVFDVKSDGWFNLLHALGDLPVGATVAFSSIAGRFGNAGQTDYSAANDLLCKSASALRRTRPQTRAIAIDWTAWAGIGMASRGSIPKMMELAGIDMLPPESGVPTVRRELVAGGFRGEVLVGDRLGVLTDEWDPTGGLDTDAADALATGPMIGHVTAMGVHRGIVAETTLDPTAQPFLPHHSFHVFGVYPWVGLLRAGAVEHPLRVLDRCRVRWGEVVAVAGGMVTVRFRPLTWDGRSLRLGAPTLEQAVGARDGLALAGELHPGDRVALHWDWVCDRLTPRQLGALRHYTARQLAIVNGLAHPAPAAVLG